MDACEGALLLTKFIYAQKELSDEDTDTVMKTYQKCYKAIDDAFHENLSDE